MFTVSWSKPVEKTKSGKKYTKADVAYYLNYGYYPGETGSTIPVANPTYTGTGETLDAAVEDLKSKITATHSKNVDAKVEATLSEFNKGLTKS